MIEHPTSASRTYQAVRETVHTTSVHENLESLVTLYVHSSISNQGSATILEYKNQNCVRRRPREGPYMAIFTNISKRMADLTSKVRFLEIVALSSHVQSTVPR
jgi:hypothetical protein